MLDSGVMFMRMYVRKLKHKAYTIFIMTDHSTGVDTSDTTVDNTNIHCTDLRIR